MMAGQPADHAFDRGSRACDIGRQAVSGQRGGGGVAHREDRLADKPVFSPLREECLDRRGAGEEDCIKGGAGRI